MSDAEKKWIPSDAKCRVIYVVDDNPNEEDIVGPSVCHFNQKQYLRNCVQHPLGNCTDYQTYNITVPYVKFDDCRLSIRPQTPGPNLYPIGESDMFYCETHGKDPCFHKNNFYGTAIDLSKPKATFVYDPTRSVRDQLLDMFCDEPQSRLVHSVVEPLEQVIFALEHQDKTNMQPIATLFAETIWSHLNTIEYCNPFRSSTTDERCIQRARYVMHCFEKHKFTQLVYIPIATELCKLLDASLAHTTCAVDDCVCH